MTSPPLVYADFHNADARGRLRLTCAGTVNDLSRQQVELREGLKLLLYTDDLNDGGNEDRLVSEGVVAYSTEEQCWVASIDWARIRHESESGSPSGDVDHSGPAVLPSTENQPSPPARPIAR
jgi:hypothetical protein